jgi:hypothetical protein
MNKEKNVFTVILDKEDLENIIKNKVYYLPEPVANDKILFFNRFSNSPTPALILDLDILSFYIPMEHKEKEIREMLNGKEYKIDGTEDYLRFETKKEE